MLVRVSVGIFFIGPYIVVFPLLVRDEYRAGVGSLVDRADAVPARHDRRLARAARARARRKGRRR